jgi:long-chain acyl-CoA synthetase
MAKHRWHEFYEKEVKIQLDYPTIPVTDFLRQAAAEYPDQDALYFFGKKMKYKELIVEAYRFANALIELGVSKGDRVALMLPSMPQYIICYYGVLFIGGIVVQTNPLYVEKELLHHLSDAAADTIVCLDLVYPRVKKIRDQVALKHVIVTSIKDYLPFPKNWLYPIVQKKKGPYVVIDYKKEPVIPFMDFISQAASHPIAVELDPMKDIAVLQYTGGTTGPAKGVMLTHYNLVVNVLQCQAWMYKNERGKESLLTVVPLFHVYGMTVCMNYSISMAGRLILIPKFEIDSLLKAIHSQKPTIFPGAPTMYIAIINHPDVAKYNISSINCCVSGSAALPIEIKQKFEKLTGGKLVEGYGLSEASPVSHVNPIWGKNVKGSVGVPYPDTECKVIDSTTEEEMEPGQIGELIIKGPQIMKGYWNQPEETAKTLKDGWLYTGDMGTMNEEGYFFIVDRKKDVIIASGFNIYPRDVEEVLYEHPCIQEAAIIGVPDDYRGETVKAIIVLKQGSEVTESELNEYCRERLASYKVPRIYEFRSDLPKTMIGKVLRRELK